MSDIAIRVENLGKAYKIAHNAGVSRYKTLQEDVIGLLKRRFSRERQSTSEIFWALRDISFEVKQGEVLGIIGRNGAGKSTLLKILSRITRPTTGYAEMHGRIGSLLEVGTGFHPELTGRENIYLSGAVLGMTRRDIDRRFDEIVAFADVEKFLDTPAKRYSSGMYMRLAFAVAAHLEPEILVVDEVLAVGDAEFQKKSLGKMDEVAKSGRTVLFVSHNMAAVQQLCARAVWLHRGVIVIDDDVDNAVHQYQASSTDTSLSQKEWLGIETAPGNDKVKFRSAYARALNSSENNAIDLDTPIRLEFTYWNLAPGARLTIAIHVYDWSDTIAFASVPIGVQQWHNQPRPVGLFETHCEIPANLMNAGTYRVEVLVLQDITSPVFRIKDLITFEVVETSTSRDGWYGPWPGSVRPKLKWATKLLDETSLSPDKKAVDNDVTA